MHRGQRLSRICSIVFSGATSRSLIHDFFLRNLVGGGGENQCQNHLKFHSSNRDIVREYQCASQSLYEEPKTVLTFFEYLRQRAFESVLSGAQDALDILDTNKAFEKPPTPIISASQATERVTPVLEETKSTDVNASGPKSAQADELSNKEKLLEPRVRHHPNRKGSRKS